MRDCLADTDEILCDLKPAVFKEAKKKQNKTVQWWQMTKQGSWVLNFCVYESEIF